MDKTGLFFCLLPRYTLLLPNEDVLTVRGKKKLKDQVTLVLCANADGSNKIPCMMIGTSKAPACIVGRTWCIPYHNQEKAWMDQPVCQIWFDTVFVPMVRKHTSRPVLLLLDKALGHFERFENDGICVEFPPPNCTSWKQPMIKE
jgi:DDE superfamily endonuclease